METFSLFLLCDRRKHVFSAEKTAEPGLPAGRQGRGILCATGKQNIPDHTILYAQHSLIL